jgi:hypothetical protein
VQVLAGRLFALIFVFLLAGCAGTLPPRVHETLSIAIAAPAGSPLADIAARAGLDADATATWPLQEAAFALDARIAAIEHATTSIDIQTYLVADDTTGRQVLRALRDAAGRGVRVRLLVDDIYTAGLDALFLGLANHPNAEVRLFNPFVAGRASTWQRFVALLSDFHRLDHRMHNKLFVADGALAIVGGRNVADEYFLRSPRGNFFDIANVRPSSGTSAPTRSRSLESAEIAAMLFTAFRIEEAIGVVRVRLRSSGALAWSVLDADGRERDLDRQPDASWWHGLRVRLLALLVPEREL